MREPGGGVRTPLGVDYTLTSEEQARFMQQSAAHDSDDDDVAEPATVQGAHSSAAAHDDGDDGEQIASSDEDEDGARDASAAMDHLSMMAAASSGCAAASHAAGESSAGGSEADSDAAAAAIAQRKKKKEEADAWLAAQGPSPYALPYPLTPIGDVNLFLHADFNLSEYGIAGGGCEVEVMIAVEEYRQRGLATEAVRLAMQYSVEVLGVERFVVKVLAHNGASVALFTRLGFKLIEYVECFDEQVLFCQITDEDNLPLRAHPSAYGPDDAPPPQQNVPHRVGGAPEEEGKVPEGSSATPAPAAAASEAVAAPPDVASASSHIADRPVAD
jgi:RimJ/RimL family protein N-acetyltransferase